MPGFNTWAPRVSPFGQHLEFIGHNKAFRKHAVGQRYADVGSTIGQGVGSAVGMGIMGADYARRWYYPSAKINVSTRTRAKYMPRSYTKTVTKRKRKYKRKTCCRKIKGKKVCHPRFCSKNKYWD